MAVEPQSPGPEVGADAGEVVHERVWHLGVFACAAWSGGGVVARGWMGSLRCWMVALGMLRRSTIGVVSVCAVGRKRGFEVGGGLREVVGGGCVGADVFEGVEEGEVAVWGGAVGDGRGV